MGNIFACFGNGKNDKRRKTKTQPSPEKKVFPKENSVGLREARRTDAADLAEPTAETPVTTSHLVAVDATPDLEDEQTATSETPLLLPTVAAVMSSPKKKVTFDLNVTEYDPPTPFDGEDDDDDEDDPTSSSVDTTDDNQDFFFDGGDDEEEEEVGKIINPIAAYPLNHRYQDCADESEFEDDYYDDDLDLVDDEDEEEEEEEESYDSYFSLRTYREEDSNFEVLKDLNSIPPATILQQPKKPQPPPTPPLRRDKENVAAAAAAEAEVEEGSVDTSLSSWLTPPKKSTVQTFRNKDLSGYSSPSFSRSPAMQSPEERPILGALTVDDLKHSPTSTTKLSPKKSPDVEMPILGTVGSYWICSNGKKHGDEESPAFTAVKGIPNTTSKYREDRRVNWHSTPFEVRLDRALKNGTA